MQNMTVFVLLSPAVGDHVSGDTCLLHTIVRTTLGEANDTPQMNTTNPMKALLEDNAYALHARRTAMHPYETQFKDIPEKEMYRPS